MASLIFVVGLRGNRIRRHPIELGWCPLKVYDFELEKTAYPPPDVVRMGVQSTIDFMHRVVVS